MKEDLCFNLCYRDIFINWLSHIITRNTKIILDPVISKDQLKIIAIFLYAQFRALWKKPF